MTTTEYNCSLISAADHQTIPVTDSMIVGRGEKSDLVIKLGQASRKHAQLTPSVEGLWVEDLQSSNGTFLNGKPVVGKVLAQHGDNVRFDTASFQVCIGTPDASDDEEDTIVPAEPKREATLPPSWALERNQSVDGTQILGANDAKPLSSSQQGNAEHVQVPTLLGLDAPVKDQRFTLIADGDTHEWDIGRAATAHIVIDHQSVSTNHAQIINDGQRWKLADLVSANGTFVNDNKGLTTYLQHGDLLRFGQVSCQFLLPSQARAAPVIVKSAKRESHAVKFALIGAGVLLAAATAAWWLLLN